MPQDARPETTDVVVVGAGPAGLHAALKAAVLNHDVLVLDKGPRWSRVSQAPRIANVPGRPGVSGPDLLAQGRADLTRFQEGSGRRRVRLVEGAEAFALARLGDGFEVRYRHEGAERSARAPVVVIATGMVDRKPGAHAFDELGHHTLAPFVHRDQVGYCLLCEGWDLAGKRVAVWGSGREAAQVAADVRDHFQGFPTLLTDGGDAPHARGLPVERRRVAGFRTEGGALRVDFEDGASAEFDKALLSLGIHRVNSDLARMAGAALTPEGFVETDANCEALDAEGRRIEGLFAIGDVRAHQWKQVVIAWGDAETAVLAAYARRLPTRRERARA